MKAPPNPATAWPHPRWCPGGAWLFQHSDLSTLSGAELLAQRLRHAWRDAGWEIQIEFVNAYGAKAREADLRVDLRITHMERFR